MGKEQSTRDWDDGQALMPLGDVVPRWRANLGHAAERLRLLREAAGFSQAELSKLIGITPEQMSNIEEGKWSPLAPVVRKLGQALDVAPERFVDDSPIGPAIRAVEGFYAETDAAVMTLPRSSAPVQLGLMDSEG